MLLDYKKIGCNIKVHRCRRGMRQAQLAELAGVSEQHISHIECGSTKLSLTVMVAIAEALSVELNELLGYHTDRALSGRDGEISAALEYELRSVLKGATDPQIRQCIEICRAALKFGGCSDRRER